MPALIEKIARRGARADREACAAPTPRPCRRRSPRRPRRRRTNAAGEGHARSTSRTLDTDLKKLGETAQDLALQRCRRGRRVRGEGPRDVREGRRARRAGRARPGAARPPRRSWRSPSPSSRSRSRSKAKAERRSRRPPADEAPARQAAPGEEGPGAQAAPPRRRLRPRSSAQRAATHHRRTRTGRAPLRARPVAPGTVAGRRTATVGRHRRWTAC